MTFQLRFEATKILKANVNEKSQNFTSRLFFYEIDLKACENTKSHLIINVAILQVHKITFGVEGDTGKGC